VKKICKKSAIFFKLIDTKTQVKILIIAGAYFAILRTTDKHPDLAAIEGMDLVTLKLGMGSKGQADAPAQPSVSSATAIEVRSQRLVEGEN
jgi:hypothetical protein